ncbi:MAG: translocation/assembly module TamB domain-containing protein [bacterium]
MKKFIFPAIVILLLITAVVVLKAINFTELTIGFIEKTAHVDIKYRKIAGNVFQGFRIEDYCIKLSPTDSIYGKSAAIAFRFYPSLLRLPNLFEVNLVEPNVVLKKKPRSEDKEGGFNVPHLNLGLRFNLKNGKLIYVATKIRVVEGISGLVFIDLVAGKVYMNTMNLSFRTKDYPLVITSANLDLRIDDNGIDAKKFKIKGKGLTLQGKGTYSFVDNEARLEFTKSRIDIEQFNIYQGTINFTGKVGYCNDKLLPNIHGTAKGVYPIDYFDFETNVFSDTLWVNIFDGRIWNGNVFAQVKFFNTEHWGFEAEFTDVDVAHFLRTKSPILVSGFLGYRNRNIVGYLHSPSEQGLDIDSLMLFGHTTGSQITMDSLFINEGKKTLTAQGDLYPVYDLEIIFNDFVIGRFEEFAPVQGEINGTCALRGSFKDLLGTTVSADINGSNLLVGDIGAEKVALRSAKFQFPKRTGQLELILEHPFYKTNTIETFALYSNDSMVNIEARKQDSEIKISGVMNAKLNGEIKEMTLLYNTVETTNRAPIKFDIAKRDIGEIDLNFIDGQLKANLEPLELDLSQGQAAKLALILGFREPIEGTIDLTLRDTKFTINAHDINFIDLNNGTLKASGEYIENKLIVESLTVVDEKSQRVHLEATLSSNRSFVHAKVKGVGIWIFPFLNKILVKPTGIIYADVTLEGNIDDFNFSGSGEIKNGSFGVDVIAAHIDSLNSKIRFDKNMIFFEAAKAKVSALGHSYQSSSKMADATAGGYIKLEPHFKVKNLNFEVSFKDAPFQYQPFAYGVGSGNFSFGMKDKISYYNGNIVVKQAIVPLEFGMQIEEEEATALDTWTMNIRIKGERNIWLRNREADIELGGELFFLKEQGPLYLSGRLETHRGNFYWLNHVLSITHGQITFIPEEQIDAEMDVWAEMDTRERHPETGEEIVIKLHCFGPMSEPIFEFFSEPAYYSEQDILTYLNLNVSWREMEQTKQGDYVEKVLPRSILSWLEGDVSRRIRRYTGLDYVRIETPFFEPESKTKLSVGKYVSRNVFVTYTYDVTSLSNEFNVEYFIDDKNEILIKRDEEGEYSLQYQYRIRF